MNKEMKSNISGYMFSYENKLGDERLAFGTFAVSKTKAKRRLKNFNHRQIPENKITPVSIYSVSLIVHGVA